MGLDDVVPFAGLPFRTDCRMPIDKVLIGSAVVLTQIVDGWTMSVPHTCPPDAHCSAWLDEGTETAVLSVAQQASGDQEFLTGAEQAALGLAAQLWNDLCALTGPGATRQRDLDEAVVHIHAIQHMVMANAAARAYPSLYRPLGGTLD